MLRSISVSGRLSIILPRLIGSADLEPSPPGLERGGGVRDIEGKPVCCGGCRFECEDVEEPGE
jgi:hypothetical protein